MPRVADDMTARYRALCGQFSVPVFHQPWWLDIACEHWTGIVAEGHDGVGIWPMPMEKKLGVRITRNPALTAYLGPVFLKASGEYATDVPSSILEQLLARAPKVPVWHIAAHPANWRTELLSSHGFEVGARPTYFLDLTGRGEDELLLAMKPELRRKIRRGLERLTIASEPEAALEMYALQTATLQRKATRAYHSAAHFSRLVHAAHERGACALWTARVHGKLVGAQWSLWDTQRCYNLGLARDEQSGEKFSSATLLWKAIAEAHTRGLRIFDFEGSSIPGIASFFAEFGGTRRAYLTLQKNTSPIWRLVRRLRP